MAIRVTGGVFGSRMIPSPPTTKTRPTASVTREALFNIIPDVDGFVMLDLFAGSGIMGIEALSRGASKVYAVEKNSSQARLIYKAYQMLDIGQSLCLLTKNALTLAADACPETDGFDLIYADPPFIYEYPDLRPFLKWLKPGGTAVFEAPSRSLPLWSKEGEVRRYGESSLIFFRTSL